MTTKRGRIAALEKVGPRFAQLRLSSGEKVELPLGLWADVQRSYTPDDTLVFVERRGRLFSFVQWVGTDADAVEAVRAGQVSDREYRPSADGPQSTRRDVPPSDFEGCIPGYLGMGVRSGAARESADGGRAADYVLGADVVARVSLSASGDRWAIEEFRPGGSRAATSYGRDFGSAARSFAASSMREGARGPTLAWLGKAVADAGMECVMLPPADGVAASFVPSVAMAQLLAARDPRDPAPVLGRGRSGVAPTPLPFGPRPEARLLQKAEDGSVLTSIPIALDEYVVPVVDACGHLSALAAWPAVAAARVPLVLRVNPHELAVGIVVGRAEDGSRWVLDTGGVAPR